MVTTRSHPDSFSTPTSSPSKSSRRSLAPSPPSWTHAPSNLILLWLAVSLPLVLWDTGFILLRPHSMPGGRFHSPIWTPYAIYVEVDYVYGWKAFNNGDGFPAAQSTMNLVEVMFYSVYLWIVLKYGGNTAADGRCAPGKAAVGRLGESRVVRGRMAGLAALAGYTGAALTVGKTLLYGLCEFYCGFENTKHNPWSRLIPFYILTNGAWILFPSYMCYIFGSEIMQGLSYAAGAADDSAIAVTEDGKKGR